MHDSGEAYLCLGPGKRSCAKGQGKGLANGLDVVRKKRSVKDDSMVFDMSILKNEVVVT